MLAANPLTILILLDEEVEGYCNTALGLKTAAKVM